jgi:pimeloyl-ACP methyl ester carboxylesterase
MTFWIPKILEDREIMGRFEVMYDQASAYAFTHGPVMTQELYQAIVDRLNERQVPTLHLVGADDTDPIRTIMGMKAVYPDVHSLLLPDAGHYPALENPHDFNRAVLNFIAGIKIYN